MQRACRQTLFGHQMCRPRIPGIQQPRMAASCDTRCAIALFFISVIFSRSGSKRGRQPTLALARQDCSPQMPSPAAAPVEPLPTTYSPSAKSYGKRAISAALTDTTSTIPDAVSANICPPFITVATCSSQPKGPKKGGGRYETLKDLVNPIIYTKEKGRKQKLRR